jgi:hypothetical protein
VAKLVGGAICLFGGRQIVTLFELHSHVERVIGTDRVSHGSAGGRWIATGSVDHELR